VKSFALFLGYADPDFKVAPQSFIAFRSSSHALDCIHKIPCVKRLFS
jgi:hypothetical protein